MLSFSLTVTEGASLLGSLSTVLLVSASFSVFVLTYSKHFREFQLRRPLRRVLSRPKKWDAPILFDDRQIALTIEEAAAAMRMPSALARWLCQRSAREAFEKAAFDVITGRLEGEDLQPADLISHVLAVEQFQAVEPCRDFGTSLEGVLRAAGSPKLTPVLTRLLFADENAVVREMLTEAANHLSRFSVNDVVPCSAPDSGENPGSTASSDLTPDGAQTRWPYVKQFASFATALSGALVLADSALTRSRYVDDVLVWHRRMYRGVGSDGQVEPSGYENRHDNGSACDETLRAQDALIGDFDRRVLSLRSVSLTHSAERGRVSFVLDTAETCYLATEQGDLNPGSDASHPAFVGCKHLSPQKGVRGVKQFEISDKFCQSAKVIDPDCGPVVLLTTYVSLITADRQLVLAKRSGQVRHGAESLSASAGGIVEPDGDGATGDVDEFGMPSPLTAVTRETLEEIGVDLDETPVRPVCVFLANVRNPAGKRAGRGQLVAVVLYLATVSNTYDEIEDMLHRADPALGGFEVDRLQAVGSNRSGSGSGHSFSQEAAAFAFQHADQLDQHGLLSCLYAAAVLDGPEVAREAFLANFSAAPWWALKQPGGPHSAMESSIRPRVVRDPRKLLIFAGDDSHKDQQRAHPLETVVPEWKSAWDELPGLLEEASVSASEHVLPVI